MIYSILLLYYQESHSIFGGIKNMTGLYLDDSMLFMHRSGQVCIMSFFLQLSFENKLNFFYKTPGW